MIWPNQGESRYTYKETRRYRRSRMMLNGTILMRRLNMEEEGGNVMTRWLPRPVFELDIRVRYTLL